jgi:glycosyltransferase involved in cell wall biosynthesis
MIYFCIPAFDEAPTIGLVLWKIRRVLEESAREYQLLVGDDASTDATAEVLAQYTKVLPLTVISSTTRRGYAATVEALLREALRRSDRHKRDVAILLPGDFSADPSELPEFLRRIDSGADVIVGESTLDGEPDKWQRRLRQFAPRLLGRHARVPGVRDVVSGYVAFRLIALRNAFRDRTEPWFTTDGWAANAQLLAWAAAGARRVETVPVVERADRHVRDRRHAPWARARALWQARGKLTAPPAEVRPERAAKASPKEKEAA